MVGEKFTVKSPETIQTCKLDHAIHLCTALSLMTLLKSFQVEICLHYFRWIYTIIFMYCVSTIQSIIMKTSNESYIQHNCSVTFVPYGILVEEFTMIGRRGQQKRKRYVSEFIPRDHIMDVIVMEVVHAYKVSSAIAFRIKRNCEICDNFELMISRNYELRPVLNRVAMTYEECIRIRQGIQNALMNS